ncbi:hypothetical protein Z945_1182 [Sulfitobacter noctilucae]|nr:hypothetical protein Z945_1182 [Sulfitobacter noctilucae]
MAGGGAVQGHEALRSAAEVGKCDFSAPPLRCPALISGARLGIGSIKSEEKALP